MMPAPTQIREMPEATRAAIDKWIKRNGGTARRFEPGASTDIEFLRNYLRKHGWTVTIRQRQSAFAISKLDGPGRPRIVSRAELFTFVDELRAKDGLPPITPKVRR